MRGVACQCAQEAYTLHRVVRLGNSSVACRRPRVGGVRKTPTEEAERTDFL